MGYGRSRYMVAAQTGDPFLGGLIKGASKLVGKGLGIAGGILPGPIGLAAKIGGGLLGGGRVRPQITPPVFPGAGGLPAPPMILPRFGGVGPRGVQQPRMTQAGGISTRKRPRMNPNNPRALRRAVRRVEAHVRQEQRIKKTMTRVASHYGSKRRSRRDAPPGHTHVR